MLLLSELVAVPSLEGQFTYVWLFDKTNFYFWRTAARLRGVQWVEEDNCEARRENRQLKVKLL